MEMKEALKLAYSQYRQALLHDAPLPRPPIINQLKISELEKICLAIDVVNVSINSIELQSSEILHAPIKERLVQYKATGERVPKYFQPWGCK